VTLHKQDLTEGERLVVERLRVLAAQDKTFCFLPQVMADRLQIMIERGAKYNGNGSSVMDQVFYAQDQSAFHHALRPMQRLKNICPKHTGVLAENDLHELPEDAANYLDMWLSCRRAVRTEGA
jgi:hypothetical protein